MQSAPRLAPQLFCLPHPEEIELRSAPQLGSPIVVTSTIIKHHIRELPKPILKPCHRWNRKARPQLISVPRFASLRATNTTFAAAPLEH